MGKDLTKELLATKKVYLQSLQEVTIEDIIIENNLSFAIVNSGESDTFKVLVDQIIPFGENTLLIFQPKDFAEIPLSFFQSFIVNEVNTEKYSTLIAQHQFLEAIIKPARIGKASELKDSISAGDILYYVEEGIAYPTIVKQVKNGVADCLYTYDSLKISDCDKYKLDLNDGSLRALISRNYPSIEHILAEVKSLSVASEEGKIRPFYNQDIAGQLINSLL